MSQLTIGTLGSLSGGNSPQDIQQLKSYISRLTEQLKYVLNNIGEENLAEEVRTTIVNTAGSVGGKVGAAELDVAVKALEGKITAAAESLKAEVAAELTEVNGGLAALEARVAALEEETTA